MMSMIVLMTWNVWMAVTLEAKMTLAPITWTSIAFRTSVLTSERAPVTPASG